MLTVEKAKAKGFDIACNFLEASDDLYGKAPRSLKAMLANERIIGIYAAMTEFCKMLEDEDD